MLHRARINIKSLAAEGKFIRQEIKRSKDQSIKNDLRNHQINKVRPEARVAHLAFAYLKGMDRRSVERTWKEDISAEKLLDKLKRYGTFVTREEIRGWHNKG